MLYSETITYSELDVMVSNRIKELSDINSSELSYLFNNVYSGIDHIGTERIEAIFHTHITSTDVIELTKTLTRIYRDFTPDQPLTSIDRANITIAFCLLPCLLEHVRYGFYRLVSENSEYRISSAYYRAIRFGYNKIHLLIDVIC